MGNAVERGFRHDKETIKTRKRDFVLVLLLAVVISALVGPAVSGNHGEAETPIGKEQSRTRVVARTTSEPQLTDWQLVEIDGIRMTEFTREELLSLVGRPDRFGTLYFVNRTYERWHWTDGREVLLVRLDGAPKFKVDRIIGKQLSVNGESVLKRGDPASQAVELLGSQLYYQWGESPKEPVYLSLSARIENGKILELNFQAPIARPQVPLTGLYPFEESHK